MFQMATASEPVVFDNPIWENARKALEAVSPKKQVKNNPTEKEEPQNNGIGNGVAPPPGEMSPKDMYYTQFSNYKQHQNMMPRPRYVLIN